MNIIKLNGRTICCSGNNVQISNNRIVVDGVEISNEKFVDPKIIIEGDVGSIKTNYAVEVHGNVTGDIDDGGSVHCKNVNGNVDAGGSVHCDDVTGDVDAGGSVSCNRIIKNKE